MLDLPPASLNLRRHGDSQTVFQWAFLVMAIAFYLAAKAKETPVMPAEVYGDWVTSFQAETWAISLMLASTIYLCGIIINGSWKWSPVLRLIGAGWHTTTLGLFCVGSAQATYGDPFALATAVFGVVHGWFCWLNIMDLRRAVENEPN